MKFSFLTMLLLASSALLLGACVGPDSWNEDPWQRATYDVPVRKLVYCVAEAGAGRPVFHKPGSDLYSIGGTAEGKNGSSEISRADFQGVGNKTIVSTYGVSYWFGPIPNHSLEIIKSAEDCEAYYSKR